jgi:hypothetical protein
MKTITKVLTVLAFAGWAGTAHAIPIVTTSVCVNDGGQQCATGITGLDIGGDIFDVSFSQLSYDDLYASSDPYFLNDMSGALAAHLAVISAMNDASIYNAIGIADQGDAWIYTPYLNDPEVFGYQAYTGTLNTIWGDSGFFSIATDFGLAQLAPAGYYVYASYSPESDMPTPTTLALFGFGLAGLGIGRRKRKLHC